MTDILASALPWLLTAVSLVGTLLVTRRRAEGFILWIISNLGWVVVDYRAGLYSQGALFGAYLILAVYGAYEWKKQDAGFKGDKK